MTNEEAIEILNNWSPWQEIGDYDRFRDALDMSIKALEQQPCEDCISRQAVLDGLASIAKAKAKSDAQKSLMGRVMFFTEQLPSVTPKGVTVTDFADRCRECGREKVLDKIREEIEHLHDWAFSREEILRIIDKYKAESDKESNNNDD